MLGLCCCVPRLSPAEASGALLAVVLRLLTAESSLVAEHKLQSSVVVACGLSCPDVESSWNKERTCVPCIERMDSWPSDHYGNPQTMKKETSKPYHLL